MEAWDSGPNIFFDVKKSPSLIKQVTKEKAVPVKVMTSEEIQKNGFNSAYDVLNNITSLEGLGFARASNNVSRTRYDEYGGKELERVEVTGSRIKRTEIYYRAPAANIAGIKKKSTSGKPRPRMRSQFLDAAYWNPDIVLAAGRRDPQTE